MGCRFLGKEEHELHSRNTSLNGGEVPLATDALVPEVARRPTVVSMFSGCGGIDLGFVQAGFDVVWANDLDADCCETYRRNIGNIIEGDVHQLEPPNISAPDVLTAGFPCQPFSNAGRRFGTADFRGNLFKRCLEFIDCLRPKIVMLENVRGLLSIRQPEGHLLVDEICEGLAAHGYEVHLKLVNAAQYGVPQNRLRVIIVGVANQSGLGRFRFPEMVHGQDLSLGACLDVPLDAPNQQDVIRLNPQALYLGSLVPEGGSWKDIPYEMLPKRLQRIRDNMRRYRWPNFYRRFSRDEIAGTITAAFKPENAGVWHPVKNRPMSVREVARIQSFPDSFVFHAASIKAMYQMVGNAVPPRLAVAFAKLFQRILDGRDCADDVSLLFCERIEDLRRPIRPTDPELIWGGQT